MTNDDTEGNQKKKSQPHLVKMDKAFKLAEQWVNNMSKSSVIEKSTAIELEGRPARLGIGATVPKQSGLARSNDPVEKKLLAKLQADRRKVIKKAEDLAPSANDEDSDEEESESKTKAFTKKRPLNLNPSLYAKKKQR